MSQETASTGKSRHGGIAQLVEHMLCKHEVTGSIPVASTNVRLSVYSFDGCICNG